MKVAVQVTGHPLQIGGARYNVGERLWLDPTNEQHREIIDHGWVRRLDEPGPPPATARVVDAPTADKMVHAAPVRKTPPKKTSA